MHLLDTASYSKVLKKDVSIVHAYLDNLAATGASADLGKGMLIHGREFAWTNADFVRVQSLIYQKAGISLHDGKQAMVYSRLSRRLRDTGHTNFAEYLASLEQNDGLEWQEFVNALTTNLTFFFREQHHFDILSTLIKKRKDGIPVRIWCSAASTGEEPYSIVITVLKALGLGANLSLVASDIDSKVLATAAAGVYKLEQTKNIHSDDLQKFFLRGKGKNAGLVRFKQELGQLIEFCNVNLIRDDWPFKQPFDVVFCRNVMIYFDAATQRKVLEKIHRWMNPGGMLFVGHAENFSEFRDLFILRGKTVYERQ